MSHIVAFILKQKFQNLVLILNIGKPYSTNYSRKTIFKKEKEREKKKGGEGGWETMSSRPPANLSD